MCDSEESDPIVFGLLVDATLHINGHSTGALIQEGKLGSVRAENTATSVNDHKNKEHICTDKEMISLQ